MPALKDKDAVEATNELASLFAHASTSVSSFELLQSGVVDALLSFATDDGRTLSFDRRRSILLDVFRGAPGLDFNERDLSIFVNRPQEYLTRMESFDVVTVSPGSDESSCDCDVPGVARLLAAEGQWDASEVGRKRREIARLSG